MSYPLHKIWTIDSFINLNFFLIKLQKELWRTLSQSVQIFCEHDWLLLALRGHQYGTGTAKFPEIIHHWSTSTIVCLLTLPAISRIKQRKSLSKCCLWGWQTIMNYPTDGNIPLNSVHTFIWYHCKRSDTCNNNCMDGWRACIFLLYTRYVADKTRTIFINQDGVRAVQCNAIYYRIKNHQYVFCWERAETLIIMMGIHRHISQWNIYSQQIAYTIANCIYHRSGSFHW